MIKNLEVYKCEICGNIVETVHGSGGELVCCNQPMSLLKENSVDAATEKHVPLVKKEGNTYHVSVGSVEHPMGDDHYIEWIELIADDKVFIKFMKPGEKPAAVFTVEAKKVYARAYCNLHGFWKSN